MSRLPLLAVAAAAAGVALATWQDARRAERARPAPGRFLNLGGLRLHYLDVGPSDAAGTPVVLLHGNGSMVEDFVSSGLVDRLAQTRRVVVFDRPGFGRTRRPRGRIWTAEAQAALLVDAMRRLGLRRAVVLGHSFGSLVAMAMALNHPEAVGGLVLESGYYFPTPRLDVVLFSPPAVPVLGDALRYTVNPPLGKLMFPTMLRNMFAPLPVPARFLREFPQPLALRPWAIRASAEDTALMVPTAANHAGRHGELRLPVEILAGDGDRIVDFRTQAEQLHAAIPASRLTILPGAGHMLHHASPETVAAAIERLAA